MSLPKAVNIREDGPREGFQIHPTFVPTEAKLQLIEALTKTGIKSIEVTSFVRSDRVPQMADAEELVNRLPVCPGVTYRALYLNEKGFLRARSFPQLKLEGYILLSASETFLKKNSNTTIDEVLAGVPALIKLFRANDIKAERLMLSAAFGDYEEGKIEAARVIQICQKVIEVLTSAGGKLGEITFADTTGFGNPEAVRRLVTDFRSRFPECAVGLHLHDTRGTGMANVYAGLQCGVSNFDCSVGGLGGCPFAKGAAGNVPTEDVAFLCEELGVSTGLDLKAYVNAAKIAEAIVGRKLPGKLKDANAF